MSNIPPPSIRRIGESSRWSDVVIHNGVAYWVEVAAEMRADAAGQIAQVLAQIDATLEQIGSRRENLLQVLIYLSELADIGALNTQWDAWVKARHAPVRACVGARLGEGCRIEVVVTAAVD